MLYGLSPPVFVRASLVIDLPTVSAAPILGWLIENALGVLSALLTVLIILIYLSQKNLEKEKFTPRIIVDQVRPVSDSPESFEIVLSNIGKGAAQDLQLCVRPYVHVSDFTDDHRSKIREVDSKVNSDFTMMTPDSEEVVSETVYETLTPTMDDTKKWIPASQTKLLPESNQVRFRATARSNLTGEERSTLLTEDVKNISSAFTALRLRLEVEYDVTYDPAELSVLPAWFYRVKQWFTAKVPGLTPTETRSSEVALDYVVPAVETDSLEDLINHSVSWERFREKPRDTVDDLRDARMKLSD